MKKYLTTNEAYIYAYNFLSDLYFQNLDDDLGGFLGSMSPEIWVGENSGDGYLYHQWAGLVNEISSSEKITLKESFLIMIKFLNAQHEQFDEKWAKKLANEILFNKKYFRQWIAEYKND
ncbi:hypothetical protein [Campylobacter concisus]|jgi:hypothetical protein|uniref:hypothetical protein n=1 Tax=Campylobacter concisus TaxID=199 RepID=UPI000CD91121|nr:hypothetical protein [Campylobacter concisus]VTY00165.1 Uncharacterised protein [Campylobacter concisus]